MSNNPKSGNDDLRDPTALVVIGPGGQFQRGLMPGDVSPGFRAELRLAAKWGAVALLIYSASFFAALLATKVMAWMGAAQGGVQ